MGLLDFLKRKDAAQSEHRLVCEWKLIRGESLNAEEGVSMKFLEDGKLVYTIHQKDRDQIINLTFRFDGNHIVTDQPSAPRTERTRFSFDANGNLMLDYGGDKSCFARV